MSHSCLSVRRPRFGRRRRRARIDALPRVLRSQQTGLAFMCPVTNQVKGGRFEVPLPAGGNVTGVVLVEQLRSVDWLALRAVRIGTAVPETLAEVLARIEAILTIEI
jgi:mRNA interferase MazF